jgi:hypothetical protein
VTAAAWVKESDGGSWYLYLVSPAVDGRDPREGYRRLLAVIRQMPPPFRVDRFEVKLIGPSEPIARAIAAIRDRSPGRSGTWDQGGNLGMLPVDAAYVYAPNNATHSSDAPPGAA